MSEDSKLKKARKTLERILRTEGGKIASLTIASYLLGLTTGAVGKEVGGAWEYVFPACLPLCDLLVARPSPYLIPYALGVATNYPIQTYEACKLLVSY
ncbi:hypothetical protein KY346_03575 [Candidatus Woesearchaeota archaeon]|nr:hypothetical protein [Candidatus Woesearchaeota archaeon]